MSARIIDGKRVAAGIKDDLSRRVRAVRDVGGTVRLDAVLVESGDTGARVYAENARKYMKKLDVLHEWCKNELSKIPSERRVLVTAHDAFSYFGKAYGVEVRAIQGVSTASEASLKHVEELIAYMVDNRIKSVFGETSVKKDSVRKVIDGCKQEGHTVALGGELFSDAMGQDGTPEGTYIGMVRHNVNTIVKALRE